MKKVFCNKRNHKYTFVPYLSMNVQTKFHGKPSILHTILIPILLKYEQTFPPSKHRGMCQLERPSASEITEPLVFTVCILELQGKAIVLQSRSRHTCFRWGQQWTKQMESNVLSQNQTKLRSKCCSVVLKKHSFWTMKNPKMKNNPGLFLEVTLATLLSSAFFTPIIFSYWLLIHLEMKH